MILKTTLTAVVAAGLLTTGAFAQQAATTSPPQTASKPGVVSLIGCVARATTTPPARGTAQPAPQGTSYKLVDVQPGTGTATNLKTDSNFLLATSTSPATPIDLGKFLNQWVEVTGTISPAPAAKVNPQATPQPTREAANGPLPTLTATALKVVSTECK